MIETSLKQLLEKESKERCISIAELCRERLRGSPRLLRIEMILEKLNRQIEKKISKTGVSLSYIIK